MRFSFLTPDLADTQVTTLYVHIQVQIVFSNDSISIRRLLQNDNNNPLYDIIHFIQSFNIINPSNPTNNPTNQPIKYYLIIQILFRRHYY